MNGAGLLLVGLGVWLTIQVLIAKPSLVDIITGYRA